MFYLNTFDKVKEMFSNSKYTTCEDILKNDVSTFNKYMKFCYHYNIFYNYPKVLDALYSNRCKRFGNI